MRLKLGQTIEQVFYYAVLFLILREWLKPIIELTSMNYLNVFMAFIAICFLLNVLQINFIVSAAVKLLFMAITVTRIYSGIWLWSGEGISFLIDDIRINIGALLGFDFAGITNPFRTVLFFVLLWMLAYLMHYWLTVRMSIFYFLVLTIFFIATLNTFTAYDGTSGIVMVLMLGLLVSAVLYLKRMLFQTGESLNLKQFMLFVLPIGLVVMRISMIMLYEIIKDKSRKRGKYQTILVYGVSSKSVAQITRLQNSVKYDVAGFLTYGESNSRQMLSGKPLYCFDSKKSFAALCDDKKVDAILFSTNEEARFEEQRLLQYCIESGIRVLIRPAISEVVDGKIMTAPIREIKIEDLLGREEIKISLEEIESNFKGKTVLVTGAAGSIGSELCRQLAGFGVKHLVLFDNAETPTHNIRLELEERFPDLEFTPIIGDVRILARLEYVFEKFKPAVVFHAAAYKHVPLMEENPCEAVLVNVCGSRNVTDMCLKHNVEMMVMISTDKAVNPTNIMGCTKRLAEIYVQSLGLALEQGKLKGKTKFVTTRFGNVLGSNGSVIPRFREQIAKGGPITVTHPDITRFFMTIPEACRLVMEAATMSKGNQIFVFDMGASVKIVNLAKKMVELAGLTLDKDIKIEYTGLRPGEKLYEEVLSNAENTMPTEHDRIRIARVREYDYTDADSLVAELETLSRAVKIDDMVRLMKSSVPEFISKNSRFEKFDKIA